MFSKQLNGKSRLNNGEMMKKYGFILGVIFIAGCAMMPSAKRVYAPVDYGAVADGQTLCTKAIQKAIDECAANGGGVVRLSGGKFLSGTIFMKSNITLEIAKGSTLLGSTNLADYPETVPAYRSRTDKYTNTSLIYGENLSNIAITGKGSYDGQGAKFIFGRWRLKKRPYGIRFISCTNVTMENITLKNSPMWMQHYMACDDVTIRNITVWNHCNRNNDMIDIDGCHNVLISGCVGDTDDDGITLKSTSARSCENVVIRDCTISSHCNAIKAGTESNGGFKNIKILNNTVRPSAAKTCFAGLPEGDGGISLMIVDGGTMENVIVSDMVITGPACPIFIRLGNRGRKFKPDMARPGVGTMRNITISNIKATTDHPRGCVIAGITGHRIEKLTLKNLDFTFPGGGTEGDRKRQFDESPGKYPNPDMYRWQKGEEINRLPAFGLFFWHVEDLSLENVKLTTRKPDARAAIVLEDASNVLIDGKAAKTGDNSVLFLNK
jgi:polygalacturonase